MASRRAALSSAVVVLLALTASGWAADPTTTLRFETRYSRLTLRTDGKVVSLYDKRDRRELSGPFPYPFAFATLAGRVHASTAIRRHGRGLRLSFGASGIEADYRLTSRPDAVVVELLRVRPIGVQKIEFARVQVPSLRRDGVWANAHYDHRTVVSLLALEPRVDAHLHGSAVTASAHAVLGLSGRKVALVVTPPEVFLRVVGDLQRAFRIPVSRFRGKTAKLSREAKRSYLFIDLTERNADEVIRYAKLGGFRQVLILSDSWSASLGSYPINRKNYPHGEAGLVRTVAKLRRAGLKVGLHMLAGFVSRTDPLLRTPSGRHLLETGRGALLAALDAHTAKLALAAMPRVRDGVVDLQIDDELITCYRRDSGGTFRRCVRGRSGTRVAAHAGGAVVRLLQTYTSNFYLADISTPLRTRIARRIAGLINRAKFDLLFVDGGGGRVAAGPRFYWAGALQTEILRRVRRPLLVEGSGLDHWLWQLYARYGCDDYVTMARDLYLDQHRLRQARILQANFMPVQLGWWGILDAALDRRATRPEEVEHYGVRSLAHGLPGSVLASLATLKGNQRSRELFRLLGVVERLRLSGRLGPALRKALEHGHWQLRRRGVRWAFIPVVRRRASLRIPGRVTVTTSFAPQPLGLRIEALPRWAPVGTPGNRLLLRSKHGLDLGASLGGGALAARVRFPRLPGEVVPLVQWRRGIARPAVDLRRHRALAMRLRVDGPLTGGPAAVLNVQLEQPGRVYRDHHIELSFRGERTMILARPSAERTLRLKPTRYPYKFALRYFDYRQVIAVNLRWMRAAPGLRVRVLAIEALTERPSRLHHPSVAVHGARLVLPVTLDSGSYAELEDGHSVRVFDAHGRSLGAVAPRGTWPRLVRGNNVVQVRAASRGAAQVTVFVRGSARVH